MRNKYALVTLSELLGSRREDFGAPLKYFLFVIVTLDLKIKKKFQPISFTLAETSLKGRPCQN